MKLNSEKKIAGLLVPVFAIRTEDDLGVGDTEPVKQMIDWCAKHGFGVLQLLPINETGEDNSPYNAISSIALDPTTIAISPQRMPELSQAKIDSIADADVLKALRQGPVKYKQLKPLKQKLLWEAFQNFGSRSKTKPTDRSKQFLAFVEQNANWLQNYTLFRSLMEENGGKPAWETWPTDQQSPQSARGWLTKQSKTKREDWRQRELFYAYIQWLAH